jgi:iron complex outermembrane recepter protein
MKKMFIFIILICSMHYKDLFPQSGLSGYIRSKKSSEKIEGANIFIPILQKGTVSGKDGFYNIENLPAGSFRVHFSFVGYKSIVLQVNLKEGKNILNAELEESNIEIGEVVVLGNSVNEIEKVSYKVEKISAEETRMDGFTTLQNSLALIPGVSELSNGLSISKPVIRGLFGYRTAAIVGGVRFDNQEWQNEHGFGVNDLGSERSGDRKH